MRTLSPPRVNSVCFAWELDSFSTPDFLERSAEDHFGEGWSHVPDEDKAKVVEKHGSIWKACEAYARQDAERISDFRGGRWCFESCRAIAEVRYEISPGTYRIEHLSSPGLGGIESDAGDDYRREIEVEQLAELSFHLGRFGVDDSSIAELDKVLQRKIPQVQGWAFIDVPG